LAERLARLGLGSDHLVVAYDDAGGTIAARLWWMLDDLGHRRVAVLDGGLQAWREAGEPISTDEPVYPRTDLRLASHWSKVIDREALRDRLGDVALLDARAGERYRGEVEPVDPAAGHIPTALSAPANANLGADGRFLVPAALRDRFVALGIGDRERDDIVTSCGSGVTACHNALAMRIAGLPDPLLYPGSFSDWSRCGETVATGAEPGSWVRED
jgi:thiosulfate/3-mercaptopyruvate sulfurtransferase